MQHRHTVAYVLSHKKQIFHCFKTRFTTDVMKYNRYMSLRM